MYGLQMMLRTGGATVGGLSILLRVVIAIVFEIVADVGKERLCARYGIYLRNAKDAALPKKRRWTHVLEVAFAAATSCNSVAAGAFWAAAQ